MFRNKIRIARYLLPNHPLYISFPFPLISASQHNPNSGCHNPTSSRQLWLLCRITWEKVNKANGIALYCITRQTNRNTKMRSNYRDSFENTFLRLAATPPLNFCASFIFRNADDNFHRSVGNFIRVFQPI